MFVSEVYNKNSLKVLQKTRLIDLFLKVKDKTGNIVNLFVLKSRVLNKTFRRLESGIAIAKNVKDLLFKP